MAGSWRNPFQIAFHSDSSQSLTPPDPLFHPVLPPLCSIFYLKYIFLACLWEHHRQKQSSLTNTQLYNLYYSVLCKANIQGNYTARTIPPQQIHNSFYFGLFSPLSLKGLKCCPFLGGKVKSATCNSLSLSSLMTGSDLPPLPLANPLVPRQFSDLQLCSNFSWFSKIHQN